MCKAESEMKMSIRDKAITGSRIAAVCGVSPWMSEQDVWSEMLGLSPPRAITPAMRRGVYLEPAITAWLSAETGHPIIHGSMATERGAVRRAREWETLLNGRAKVEPWKADDRWQLACQSREHPIVVASPDGLIRSAPGGKLIAAAEIKAPGMRTIRDWRDPSECANGIPEYYLPQVMWQMAACELDRVIVGALLGGELKIYNVCFDHKLFSALMDRAREFMRYVELREPPPITTERGAEWIREYHRTQESDDVLTLDTGCVLERQSMELIGKYKTAQAAAKEAEKQQKLAAGGLIEIIGKRAGIKCPHASATYKSTKQRQEIDWESIARAVGASDDIISSHTHTVQGTRRLVVKSCEATDV